MNSDEVKNWKKPRRHLGTSMFESFYHRSLIPSLTAWAKEYHCKNGTVRMPDMEHAVITFEKSTHATWFLMTNNLPMMFLAEKIS